MSWDTEYRVFGTWCSLWSSLRTDVFQKVPIQTSQTEWYRFNLEQAEHDGALARLFMLECFSFSPSALKSAPSLSFSSPSHASVLVASPASIHHKSWSSKETQTCHRLQPLLGLSPTEDAALLKRGKETRRCRNRVHTERSWRSRLEKPGTFNPT